MGCRSRLGLLIWLLACAGCTTIEPVPFLPFAEGRRFVLTEPMTYRPGGAGSDVVIPAGFVTDFASTPQSVWSLYPLIGRYMLAAVVHDYLYWVKPCSREQADVIFRQAMQDSGVAAGDLWIIYNAVRIGGVGPWAGNEDERLAGGTRFVVPRPDGRIRLPAGEDWVTLRSRSGQTELDRAPVNAAAYCAEAEALPAASSRSGARAAPIAPAAAAPQWQRRRPGRA
jgi:hypothetical protein